MNLLDYIKWRGDLSFKQDPFNEVDNLIFCQMLYTLLEDVIKDINESYTIEELSNYYFEHADEEELRKSKSFVASAPFVLKEMAKVERFKNCLFHHFEYVFDPSSNQQFCCAQVDLDNDITVVIFRGTDDTIVGWKEDFDISYKITEAQKSSTKYVETYLDKKRKYIFTGHSKGGNLSIYAACTIKKELSDNIIKVYSNDGPGLNEEFIDKNRLAEIENRYEKIVPEFDVIGSIFDQEILALKVVEATGFGLFCHDAMNWQVEGNRFIYKDSITPESFIIKKGLADFMLSVDNRHREIFVNELFAALFDLGVRNVSNISKASIKAFGRAAKKLIEMDDEAKYSASKLLEVITGLINFMIKDLSINVYGSIDKTKIEIDDKLKNISKDVIDTYEKANEMLDLKVKELQNSVTNKVDKASGIVKKYIKTIKK